MSKRPLLDLGNSQQRGIGDNKNYGTEPYKVLLFTIIKPDKPIDVNILYKICTPLGRVIRIVIFRTKGVQAMIEFDNIETARKVKDALNGEDIYADCCTLKIEFAKPQLTVLRNNKDSWDYTNPNLGSGDVQEAEPKTKKPLLHEPLLDTPSIPDPDYHKPSLLAGHKRSWGEREEYLPRPPSIFDHAPLALARSGRRSGYPDYEEPDYRHDYKESAYPYGLPPPPPPIPPYIGGYDERYPLPIDRYRDSRESLSARAYAHDDGAGQSEGSPVLMVYKLNPQEANCDRLFNLFCLYGNVIRIKFLKTREGSAMVEMGDSAAVEQCLKFLQNLSVFDGVIKLAYSKQPCVSVGPHDKGHNLPDGTPAFKDFTGNKLQRFLNHALGSRYLMEYPTKRLHFFGTPCDFTEEHINKIFEECIPIVPKLKKPRIVKCFSGKDNKTIGNMDFDEIVDAVTALVYLNHKPISTPESNITTSLLKLCFFTPKNKSSNGPPAYKEIDY